MNLILFDSPSHRASLLPFTFTRPTAAIRVGLFSLAEKWSRRMNTTPSFSTLDYLQNKYPTITTTDNTWVDGALCPDDYLVKAVQQLQPNSKLMKKEKLLAVRNSDQTHVTTSNPTFIEYNGNPLWIDRAWKIFQYNGEQIRADIKLISLKNCIELDKCSSNTTIYGKDIYVESGTSIKSAILNAENGPIYIGKHAQIGEGAMIRGPFAMCNNTVVEMGAKIKGDTTIGPYAKVGGEISNTVFLGYSNKIHDGFLGNAVIGEWCNIGAGTVASNLKNNYGRISMWDYVQRDFCATDLQFCGLMMGDYSRCAINTAFNTGTVVGVGSNIFGLHWLPRYIPSFAWGGSTKATSTFTLKKMLQMAAQMMERRSVQFNSLDIDMITKLYAHTSYERTWENAYKQKH